MTGNVAGKSAENFRNLLLVEREEALQLIADIGHDIDLLVQARHGSNNDDEHDPEGSTLAFERSQMNTMLAQSTQRLADIGAALERLDAGIYGVCESCGTPIATARLEARPYARTCMSCASQ